MGMRDQSKRIAVGAAGLGVRRNASSIVIDVGGDEAGAQHGKEKSDAATPGFAAREKIESAGADAVDDVVDGG